MKIVIAGSATDDAGVGMIQALGMRAFDAVGNPLGFVEPNCRAYQK